MHRRYLKRFLEHTGETLGQMITKHIESEPELGRFISPYTKDIPQDVDMANAIDTCDNQTKIHILRAFKEFTGQTDSKVTIHTSDTELVSESAGKGVFNSFLKTLTSLGHKNNELSNSVPEGFMIFFQFPVSDKERIKEVFKRFRSLAETQVDQSSLYYGIKDNLVIEYGVGDDVTRSPIGMFTLTKGVYDKLMSSGAGALSGLKKVTGEMTFKDLVLVTSLHRKLKDFNPTTTISCPKIVNRTYIISYKGFGTWNNGIQELEQLQKFRDLVKEHMKDFRNRQFFKLNVTGDDFWTKVSFHMKEQ